MPLNFDASHVLLGSSNPNWEPEIRAQHDEARRKMIEHLAANYGTVDIDQTVTNAVDFGSDPWIMVGWHVEMWREVKRSFIGGAYYPAAVAAGTLAERVLNHLLNDLQDRCATAKDRAVLARSKAPTFGAALDILERWKVLEPSALHEFRKLQKLRNRLVHFDHSLQNAVRSESLEAVQVLRNALDAQFGVFVSRRMIPGLPGVVFLRQAVEHEPFVETYLLPTALHVGPSHEIAFEAGSGLWRVLRDEPVDVGNELDGDSEFVRRFLGQ